MPEAVLATFIGLLGGVVLGLAARLSQFCSLGAIEDAIYGRNFNRLRMWGIAIGTSIILVHVAVFQKFFSPGPLLFWCVYESHDSPPHSAPAR